MEWTYFFAQPVIDGAALGLKKTGVKAGGKQF